MKIYIQNINNIQNDINIYIHRYMGILICIL